MYMIAQDFIPHILQTYDRKPNQLVWTEGLQFYGGKLYESTGPFSPDDSATETCSSLQQLEFEEPTLEVKVRRRFDLLKPNFAEGLTRIEKTLFQLVKDDSSVLTYALEPLEQTSVRLGATPGVERRWGLCFDPTKSVLYLSDGSSTLKLYAQDQFTELKFTNLVGLLEVTLDGEPVGLLNSLEFANGFIYACETSNWEQSNRVLKIDPNTGDVVADIDAQNLRDQLHSTGARDLNGIAYAHSQIEDGAEVFFVTGKFWSKIFKVQFILKNS
jgi:glutaminyl-peptide cyclotransferase